MEPERKIEKLLRAYAKKRKADAGDAFKLHPATRRLLQGEVARRLAEDAEEESVSLWQLFQQRWAFLLSFALVIFFGAVLLLPALSKAKMKAKGAIAMSQLKEIGQAAQMAAAGNNGKLPVSLDALTNELASDKILTDPVSGKRFIYVAGGEILDELQTNSVLAYSPGDKKGRAVLLADGRVEKLNVAQFEALNQQGLIQHATPMEVATRRLEVAANNQPTETRPAAVAAPVFAAGNILATNGIDGFAVGGAMARADSGSAATSQPTTWLAAAEKSVAFKTDGALAGQPGLNNNSQRYRQMPAVSAKSPPVLDSFEVQQSGSNLAVVDRDGSVYNGSIQPQTGTDQSVVPAAAPPTLAKAKDSSLNKNESQAAQNNYFFRVAGQNRTSKQNVVFSGNLIPLTNVAANVQQGSQGNNANAVGGSQSQTAAAAPQSQSQSLFSNSRIAGTVTVDATNQIEINAVPVAP